MLSSSSFVDQEADVEDAGGGLIVFDPSSDEWFDDDCDDMRQAA